MTTPHPVSRMKSEVSSLGDTYKSQDYGGMEVLNNVSKDLTSNASTVTFV